MSLMKTLAKVAIGVAVAKGASHLMKGRSGAGTGSGGGLGGLLGGLSGDAPRSAGTGKPYAGSRSSGSAGGRGVGSAGRTADSSDSLQDMLGGLLSGAGGTGGSRAGGVPGGLGGLLESLGGKGGTGGLQDMLGGLAGAAGAGGLLGGLSQSLDKRPARNDASFGQVLNSAFDETPQPEIEPTADQEAAAALLLRAMIQAAKADGEFDEDERSRLLGQLGEDVDKAEAAFVNAQLQAPLDVAGLVADTPQGMERQVYAVSVLGITLDNRKEAEHLHKLAKGFGMQAQAVNDIHAELGVPSLYT